MSKDENEDPTMKKNNEPMKSRPTVVAFDVVETLFSLDPMRARLCALGLAGDALELWFARLLRDAFALDASGTFKTFGEVARATLEVMLAEHRLTADAVALGETLAGLGELPAHADVAPAFQILRNAGVRLVALTNGNADNTRRLLERAGLEAQIERVISIDGVCRWKPAGAVYLHAAKVAGVAPDELALVAAHAWDIQGASRAGLVTGWVSWLEKQFSPAMNPPDVTGATLIEVSLGLLTLAPSNHHERPHGRPVAGQQPQT